MAEACIGIFQASPRFPPPPLGEAPQCGHWGGGAFSGDLIVPAKLELAEVDAAGAGGLIAGVLVVIVLLVLEGEGVVIVLQGKAGGKGQWQTLCPGLTTYSMRLLSSRCRHVNFSQCRQ